VIVLVYTWSSVPRTKKWVPAEVTTTDGSPTITPPSDWRGPKAAPERAPYSSEPSAPRTATPVAVGWKERS
jgi:hypothetical protein